MALQVDIEKLNFDELRELVDAASSRAQELLAGKAAEMRKKWADEDKDIARRRRSEARAAGLTYEEVAGKPRRASSRRPAKPKYRNPQNPSVTWTGKGRKPRWVEEALGRGKTLEDLQIRSSA